MKRIAVYGAGGFGRETMLSIEQINYGKSSWEILGFFDDGMPVGKSIGKWKVLGGIDEVNSAKSEIDLAIAIADGGLRSGIVAKIKSPKVSFPTIIHPGCQSGDPENRFGKGCILTTGVILTTEIIIGDFVIVNLSTTVGHNVHLGNFATIMPGCSISGNVTIGEGSMIGTGARILQNLSIGRNCHVGAGSVVTHNFSEGKTIIGIPAHEK